LTGAAENLDPRFATDATSARVNRLLYARLVDFDARSRPVPALAEWERIAPTHYRFKLGDEGRTFHDGSRLTAEDVKATYDDILNPLTGSPHRSTLALIERIEVLSDDQLDFFLSRADPMFPGYLVIGILPKQAIIDKHPFAERPLGSGPLRFVARPDPNRLVLERVADGQRIEVLRVKDPTVRALKLVRGELDLLQNDMPAEILDWLARRDGIQVVRAPGSNFSYIGFNMQDPVTGRLAVREAVAHAIDRAAIVEHVMDGGARLAGALLPPDHWAGNPDLAGRPYDPDRARTLLAAQGFGPDRPLRITYKTSSDPLRIRLATIIQDQLGRVGIDVQLKSFDWGTFYGDIKAGRFQMYSLAWVGVKTPDIFRYVFHSSAAPPDGANRGRFSDPAVDLLIEAAEAATGLSEQAPLYRVLQARIDALLPYVPLWYEDHVYAARIDISGYRLAPDGNYDGLLSVRRGYGG